jgi:hypothetical protein
LVIPISAAGVEGTSSTASSSVVLLDPSGDRDGDGQNNAAEDTAGTDPFDSSSLLKATATAIAGNGVSVTISSVPGKIYQLETSTTLAPGSWTPAGDPVEAVGTSTVLTHQDGSGDPRRFYRARVVP